MEVSPWQVVTENTLFHGGVTAINNFGAGGTNVHVLLKGLCKPPTGGPSDVTDDAGRAILAECTSVSDQHCYLYPCTQVH